jgi:hypothetical protein
VACNVTLQGMVAISYEGLSALITAMVVMKINSGSIQRVEPVKCCVILQL